MNHSNTDEKNGLLLKLPKWKIWYVMVVIYLLFFMDMACRTVISPMFPMLQKDLGLTDSQLGFLTSLLLVTVTLLALPISYFIDRWRRGKLISLLAITWSLSSIFSGLSTNFLQLATFRGILGVGESAFASGGMAMIFATIKKNLRATITGIWSTAMIVGSAFGFIVGGWLAVSIGWRTAFVAMAIPGLILAIFAWFMPDYKNRSAISNEISDHQGPSFIGTIKMLLKNRTLLLINIAFGLFWMFNQALTYWLPTYLNRYLNVDVAMAGTLTGLMILCALVGTPLGGILTDRIAKKNPSNKMLLCFTCTTLSLISFLAGLLLQISAFFYIGIFFTALFTSAQMTSVQELVPADQRSSSYGLFLLAEYLLGGFWGPGLTGIFSDKWGLSAALLIILGISCIAVPIYLVAARYFNRDYQAAQDKDIAMATSAN